MVFGVTMGQEVWGKWSVLCFGGEIEPVTSGQVFGWVGFYVRAEQRTGFAKTR